MSENTQVQQPPLLAIKKFMSSEGVTAKFTELLGKKAPGFITSVLQLCNHSKMLANCEPQKIYQAAAMAAMLDLPLNPNLGFAYIIPYNEKYEDAQGRQLKRPVPQIQMGYKGIIQLCQRTGLFKTMNVTDVRDGEIKYHNRLTGDVEFNWNQDVKARNKLPIDNAISSSPVYAALLLWSMITTFPSMVRITRSILQWQGSGISTPLTVTYSSQYSSTPNISCISLS